MQPLLRKFLPEGVILFNLVSIVHPKQVAHDAVGYENTLFGKLQEIAGLL